MALPDPPPSSSDEPDELASSPFSLHRAVYARRSEYVRPRQIKIKIGTWNVAALPGTDKDLAAWFVSGRGDSLGPPTNRSRNPALASDDSFASASLFDADDYGREDEPVGDGIDLYVLGLQEVVDLGPSQYLNRVVAEDPTRDKWKVALQAALPDGYQLVSCEQMSGLLLLVYASPSLAPSVGGVHSCSIGTGMMGWVGNKGAVATRVVLAESTKLAFVNSHLASGHDAAAADRRVWDASQIQARTLFPPVSHAGAASEDGNAGAGDTLDDMDAVFWFGDLNFRLEGLPGADIRRLLSLHTRGEYDLLSRQEEKTDPEGGDGIVVVRRASESSEDTLDGVSAPSDDPSSSSSPYTSPSPLPDPDGFDIDPHDDPASLQATLDSLLPHDQLGRLIKAHKIFHDGWREGPIAFLPTYKYDVGAVSLFDSSEKKRAPSWCDRVLYRTRADRDGYEKRVREREEARRRDDEMRALGVQEASEDEEVLFDYDPDSDGAEPRFPAGQAGFDYDEYDDEGDNDGGGTGLAMPGSDASPDRLRLDSYTSHQRVMSSDHKPIVCAFTLDYDAVMPELKARVHAEVARELDRAENEGRPVLTIVIDGGGHPPQQDADNELSRHAVDFGEVAFLARVAASLTLANTGSVPATFSFVEKPTTIDTTEIRPDDSWLTTSFSRLDDPHSTDVPGAEVTLEPGETVRALLEICVDDVALARRLNDGQASLEDVLVLRVVDGRDHFIPVRAAWAPTCVGRSMDELIRVPNGGIRGFGAARSGPDGRPGSVPYDADVHFAAPKELFKLTEAVEILTERAVADAPMLDQHQIPQDAGWPFAPESWKYAQDEPRRSSHTARLVEVLDTDRPVLDAFAPETPSAERLERVSEVLVLFLSSLTDGVVTAPLWARIEQAPLSAFGRARAATNTTDATATDSGNKASEDDKADVLDILSTAPNHNIAFVFLTATVAKIIAELAPVKRPTSSSSSSSAFSGEPIRTSSGWGVASLGRRPLSFRRSVTAAVPPEIAAALARQQAKQRRFAEILGRAVCRAPVPSRDKDRRSLEDRQRAVVELFLKRRPTDVR